MRHVVSVLIQCLCNEVHIFQSKSRHASIDAKTRALRGLPEDLIRLCVGIEDPVDLIEDLEHAMFEAGAISLSADGGVTINQRGGMQQALQQLENASTGLDNDTILHREWLVSAPGKVILFGEHAVVHGVVSQIILCDLLVLSQFSDRNRSFCRSPMLWSSVPSE